MAPPVSILNDRGQSTDTPYSADGVQKVKLAVGEVVVGLTPKAGFQGIATHIDGDAFPAGSTAGVVVGAGIVAAGPTVKAYAVDSNGLQKIGQQADDTAFAGDGYVFPVGFKADETATDSVDEGDIGAGRMTLDRKQIKTEYAHAAGGATPYHLLAAGTTNATSVKNTPGRLYSILVNNLNAAVRYLKFYDKASAPVPATDTVKYVVPIPAGAVVSLSLGVGLDFAVGIAFALVTGISNTDATAVTANEHVVELAYA